MDTISTRVPILSDGPAGDRQTKRQSSQRSFDGEPTNRAPPRWRHIDYLGFNSEGGYYHVKAKDSQEGWVWARNISVQLGSPTPPQAPSATSSSSGVTAQCDDTLWNHVYHPQRLIVKQQCIAVTGTIVDATNGRKPDGVRHEGDGDTHGWLNVDAEFTNLLNAGNMSDEGGNLVFEIVCKFHVTQADAQAACPQTYHSPVQIPPVGSHVRIVGTYVQDTNHAQWMEIHPVTSISVIP